MRRNFCLLFPYIQAELKRTIKLNRQLSDLVAYTRSISFKGLELNPEGE